MFDVSERIMRGMDKYMEDHKPQHQRIERLVKIGRLAGQKVIDTSLTVRGAKLGNLQTKPRGLRRSSILLASYFQPSEFVQFWAFRQIEGTREGVDFARTEGLELPEAWDSLQPRLGNILVGESDRAERGLKNSMETYGIPLVMPTVVISRER